MKLLPYLFIRTPYFNANTYQADELEKILSIEWFRVAIYLASEPFFRRLESVDFDFGRFSDKEKNTIQKYFNRMCFRSTPFGACTTFSVLNLIQANTTNLQLETPVQLKIAPDESINFQVTTLLKANYKQNTQIRLNPTVYKLGREFRFIKTNWDKIEEHVAYHLESMDFSSILQKVISKMKTQPMQVRHLMSFLIEQTNCSEDEASIFINNMAISSVIEVEPYLNLIGPYSLDCEPRCFNHANTTLSDNVHELADAYKNLEANVSDFKKAENKIRFLLGYHEKTTLKRFFNVNVIRKAHGTLASSTINEIMEAVSFLQNIGLNKENQTLRKFITAFKNRFDQQEVSLLNAIDPDIGITYGNVTQQDGADLLADMPVSESKQPINMFWTELHRLLAEKWFNAKSSSKTISFAEKDVPNIIAKGSKHPASMPVLFSLAEDFVVIEAIGGISALPIIGRFTMAQPETWEMAKQIAVVEQQNNPNIIFAEINCVSDIKVDNINRRQALFGYEISINATSSNPLIKQIALSDLYLSISNDELILKSRSLKKRIIPRLSTAYNTFNNQLGLFRMLCDLQYQGVHAALTFDPEDFFPGLGHYPRIVFKKTILSLAKWYIRDTDLSDLQADYSTGKTTSIKRLQSKLGLSKIIAWTKGDQQLVFDLENEKEVRFFLECVKNEKRILLREFLMPGNRTVVDNHGELMAHQLILFIQAGKPTYAPVLSSNLAVSKNKNRNFILGSEWLYFKIYCAPLKANEILIQKILPFIRRKARFKIIKWFFVRYTDSGPHLRLRFLVDGETHGLILKELKNSLSNDINARLIQEYQADTYKREIERYGDDLIQDVEVFFNTSSQLIVEYIKNRQTGSISYPYHALAFVDVSTMLAIFFPAEEDRFKTIALMAETFLMEKQDQKKIKVVLDLKFRKLGQQIGNLLAAPDLFYKQLKLLNLRRQLTNSLQHIAELVAPFDEKRKTQLMVDLSHMHLNRLFSDEQRYHELVIYYCLYKHMAAQKAKNKATTTNSH